MVDDASKEKLQSGGESPQKLTKRIAWSSAFVALCGAWQYGVSVGSINAVRLPIKEAIANDFEARWDRNVSTALVDGIWVACSAAFPLGGILGAILVSCMARKFKTLNGLAIGHILTIVFSAALALSGVLHIPELLVIGRLGIGFTSAVVATGLSVVYVVEVTPRHLRGVFGTMINTGIVFGFLMTNILGLPQILGNAQYWQLLLALTGVPSVLFCLLIKTFVDTSRKTIKNEVQMESLVKREEDQPPIKKMTIKEVLCSRHTRRQLLCGVTLCACHQLTGLNGVTFNMNQIYFDAGMAADQVYYASIGVATALIVLSLITAYLTDKYGRKGLLITGYGIESIGLILLAVSIQCKDLSHIMPFVSIVASLGFWLGFAIGPGPLTLVSIAEFFDLSARSAGITIATVVMWCSFVATVVATPYMLASIGGYTFLPFGILATLAALFIWHYVPETKNRTFSEIQKSFLRAKDRPA